MTPEQSYQRHSGVFIVNFEHMSHLVLVFLLLTLNVIAGWVVETFEKRYLEIFAKEWAVLRLKVL